MVPALARWGRRGSATPSWRSSTSTVGSSRCAARTVTAGWWRTARSTTTRAAPSARRPVRHRVGLRGDPPCASTAWAWTASTTCAACTRSARRPRHGEVVLARDPLGMKPLYWVHVDDRVVAASELCRLPGDLRPRVEEFPPGRRWSRTTGLQPFVDLQLQPLGGTRPPVPRQRGPAKGPDGDPGRAGAQGPRTDDRRRTGRGLPVRRPRLEHRRGDPGPPSRGQAP